MKHCSRISRRQLTVLSSLNNLTLFALLSIVCPPVNTIDHDIFHPLMAVFSPITTTICVDAWRVCSNIKHYRLLHAHAVSNINNRFSHQNIRSIYIAIAITDLGHHRSRPSSITTTTSVHTRHRHDAETTSDICGIFDKFRTSVHSQTKVRRLLICARDLCFQCEVKQS